MVSVCKDLLCVLRAVGRCGGDGSDSHRDCGYIECPHEDWQLWPHAETNSPFSRIHLPCLWSQRVPAPLCLYPNPGPLQVHGPTQYTHISSWRIVGNSEIHRPHAEHGRSAYSGTSFKLRCSPVAPASVGPF